MKFQETDMCWELMIDSNIVAVDVWTDSPYQTKVKFNGQCNEIHV